MHQFEQPPTGLGSEDHGPVWNSVANHSPSSVKCHDNSHIYGVSWSATSAAKVWLTEYSRSIDSHGACECQAYTFSAHADLDSTDWLTEPVTSPWNVHLGWVINVLELARHIPQSVRQCVHVCLIFSLPVAVLVTADFHASRYKVSRSWIFWQIFTCTYSSHVHESHRSSSIPTAMVPDCSLSLPAMRIGHVLRLRLTLSFI